MATLDNFTEHLNPVIIDRGLDYFEQQAVESLEETSRGIWEAVVEGTEDYTVEIAFSNNTLDDYSCDCPYDRGPVCKHIVAVLFAIRERPTMSSNTIEITSPTSFEELLVKISLKELRDFIRAEKKESRAFADKFRLFFSDKDKTLDVPAKYKKLVRQIIHKHSDRGFMGYRQTFAFSKEIQSVFTVANAKLAKSHHDAFVIAKILCTEIIEFIPDCDDSAGNIGGNLSEAIAIFEDIVNAKNVKPAMLHELFDFIQHLLRESIWFDFGDFGYELLAVAEKAALATEPTKYLNLLDTLATVHTENRYDYEKEYFTKTKIQFLKSIGQITEAEQLVVENLNIVAVRKMQVKKTIEHKDFETAKVLLHEGIKIAESKKHPGTTHQWKKMLLEIAQEENDIDTIRSLSKAFAFDRTFDAENYRIWKGTFSSNQWDSVLQQHIQTVMKEERAKGRKTTWSKPSYTIFQRLSPLFIEEKMWQKLLDCIPKKPNEHILFQVHPHLMKTFPQEMLAFYLKVLDKLSNEVSDRKGYQHLTSLMKKIKQDIENSHTEIDELAATLMQKYPRRPAMLDELRKMRQGR